MSFNPFHHYHLAFQKADPLGGGLREDIACEQCESDAIRLQDGLSEDELTQYWQSVEADIHRDPQWFTFTDE